MPNDAPQPAAAPSSTSPGPGVHHGDQFVLIRIDGMHCHRCEQAIKKSVQRIAGVHEAEVDFASGQASVLFDPKLTTIPQLIEAVKATGYKPVGYTQSNHDTHADSASSAP